MKTREDKNKRAKIMCFYRRYIFVAKQVMRPACFGAAVLCLLLRPWGPAQGQVQAQDETDERVLQVGPDRDVEADQEAFRLLLESCHGVQCEHGAEGPFLSAVRSYDEGVGPFAAADTTRYASTSLALPLAGVFVRPLGRWWLSPAARFLSASWQRMMLVAAGISAVTGYAYVQSRRDLWGLGAKEAVLLAVKKDPVVGPTSGPGELSLSTNHVDPHQKNHQHSPPPNRLIPPPSVAETETDLDAEEPTALQEYADTSSPKKVWSVVDRFAPFQNISSDYFFAFMMGLEENFRIVAHALQRVGQGFEQHWHVEEVQHLRYKILEDWFLQGEIGHHEYDNNADKSYVQLGFKLSFLANRIFELGPEWREIARQHQLENDLYNLANFAVELSKYLVSMRDRLHGLSFVDRQKKRMLNRFFAEKVKMSRELFSGKSFHSSVFPVDSLDVNFTKLARVLERQGERISSLLQELKGANIRINGEKPWITEFLQHHRRQRLVLAVLKTGLRYLQDDFLLAVFRDMDLAEESVWEYNQDAFFYLIDEYKQKFLRLSRPEEFKVQQFALGFIRRSPVELSALYQGPFVAELASSIALLDLHSERLSMGTEDSARDAAVWINASSQSRRLIAEMPSDVLREDVSSDVWARVSALFYEWFQLEYAIEKHRRQSSVFSLLLEQGNVDFYRYNRAQFELRPLWLETQAPRFEPSLHREIMQDQHDLADMLVHQNALLTEVTFGRNGKDGGSEEEDGGGGVAVGGGSVPLWQVENYRGEDIDHAFNIFIEAFPAVALIRYHLQHLFFAKEGS